MRPVNARAGILLLTVALTGCSIRQAAYDSVADMLAPPPSDRTKTSDRTTAEDGRAADPFVALTGENDPRLVSDFFPTALKLYEIMHLQNPKHFGLAVMSGRLYITYANAFVQAPAERLPADRYDEQNAEYRRAENFYLRGKDYALGALERKYRGFGTAVFGRPASSGAVSAPQSGLPAPARDAMLARCRQPDAEALYWAGAGLLGAFALDPLNTAILPLVPGAVALLERSAALDPAYSLGAASEALMSFYASAPEGLGGNREKAAAAYREALRLSGGKSPSLFVGYARAFCVADQDGAGFDEAVGKALAIDPDSVPENRLAVIIAQEQARWLREHKADFILFEE